MAPDLDDASSIDSELEWELEEGIPQPDDPFIQKYMTGRSALIDQEKKQRHDAAFQSTMTPLAKQAAKILSSIRRRELRDVWTSEFEESLMDRNGGNLYPGMMFTLARDRMERTETWKIIEKMPKGSLLHAHLDAMVDIDWLIEQLLAEQGMCILAPEGLSDKKKREIGTMEFRVFSDEELKSKRPPGQPGTTSVWSVNYSPFTPIPVREAARMFPDDSMTFKKWLLSRCTITIEESVNHHHGLDAIWRKFQSTMRTVDWMLMYEPIFRRAIARLLGQLADDGISYVELRTGFMFEYRNAGEPYGRDNHESFFAHFNEILTAFRKTNPHFGARIIWTAMRWQNNRQLAQGMKKCIAMKRKFPQLISGFDFVAQEDKGRTLADLVPLIFWFRKQCHDAGVDLPFFFHAGECLGDGNSTDHNLFDAILLGTRRIGHGYSLYKHPLLIEMVKDKKILIESCPISNEILRLSGSILSHSLPALLARGVPVSLNNDDPAILGHGRNGLSHDFYQCFMAWDNMGLAGLATVAENSIKWSCVDDCSPKDWLAGIDQAYMGKGPRAKMLRAWRDHFEKWCQWVCLEWPEEVEESEEEEEEEDDDDEDGDDDEDDEEEEDEE